MSEENLKREQDIVDQAQKLKVLDDIKAYPGMELKEPMTLDSESLMTVAEYMLYLENQQDCVNAGLEGPPSPKQRDWVQKDIQIIMKDSGDYGFVESAKIINLSGRVLVHRGERDFIRATLDEAPANMRFTLIEELPRIQRQVVSAVTGDRNITIHFSDGSSEVVAATPEKKETSEEWD